MPTDSVSRAALITGCSSGIGRATAEHLAGRGWTVYASARRPESIADLERTGCRLLALDVTDEDSMAAAVRQVEEAEGAVGVLVNNAGYSQSGPVEEVPLEDVRRQFETSVFGLVRLTQLVLPGMVRRGWGRIVVISSVWGREAGGAPAYNAAKAAEISFTTSLARDVASQGVTVNCVAPGSILWEGGGWSRRQQADPDGIAEFVSAEMPLGRFGAVEEVASVVAFVCSQQASLVNGACIAVDGGQSRSNI